MELEDELGDIMSKARDGKDWSQTDLAESIEMTLEDVVLIENYEWTPNEKSIFKIANALNLLGPSMADITTAQWIPENETSDSNSIDIICLNVFMSHYPVKYYLLICRETRATAIIDSGANPESTIKKTSELRC